MSDSSSLQEEYKQLRRKIDARVKDLQSKLVDQNKTSASYTATCPMHGSHIHGYRYPISSQNHNHYLLNTDRQSNLMEVSSRMTQQYQAANNSIADALRQNMKIQKQMSHNLKVLSQRILDMSQISSQRAYKEQQNSYNRYPRQRIQRQTIFDSNSNTSKQKSHSLMNYPRSHSNLSHHPRYFHRKSRQRQFISKNKNKNGVKKVEPQDKYANRYRNFNDERFDEEHEQYFGVRHERERRCPHEEAKKMKNKVEKRKKTQQIYRDSSHRNKKHEKDHLVNAYNQQEKSRKELLSKVAKNFTNASNKKI